MTITAASWSNYTKKLSKLCKEAGDQMAQYIAEHGTSDTKALMDYAMALVQKYGEGSASLACQMYDEMAELAGTAVSAAEPADVVAYKEVAKMINSSAGSPPLMESGVNRLVKLAAADTTLKNAIRDRAEYAWITMGDTCAFCRVVASRGWQTASESILKGGHADHIHGNCDCEFAIRFDSRTNVAGYDPDKYLAEYRDADGNVNKMRRKDYAKNQAEITAQKRAAYAARKERLEQATE